MATKRNKKEEPKVNGFETEEEVVPVETAPSPEQVKEEIEAVEKKARAIVEEGDDEEVRKAEMKRLEAENERLKSELERAKRPLATIPVDKDHYLFIHTGYKGCNLHLPNGKVVEFKNRFGKIRKSDKFSYEALKECEDFKRGLIVEYTDGVQVEDYSPRVSEGVITTITPQG